MSMKDDPEHVGTEQRHLQEASRKYQAKMCF